MLKELWAYVRILWAIHRELNLRVKLAKHRCMMVDVLIDVEKEFTGRKFTSEIVQQEFDQLESRIENRFM